MEFIRLELLVLTLLKQNREAKLHSNKRVMVVDMFNMFYRAWVVDPSLSLNGPPIGGLKGSLKILQKLSRDIKPDKILICWDGPGGSFKRRSINKNYKEGRKPARCNWGDSSSLSPEEKEHNRKWQQLRLMDYFNELPVCQLFLHDIEADDIISFACQLPHLKGWQKIIVSSDKDFYQLLDNETLLFRPIQKQLLNKNDIINEFSIHPNNFTLARAMVGDKSDGLKGVPGVGLKTIAKRFPFLAEEMIHSLNRIITHCQNTNSKLKVYENIQDHEELIIENYTLMQLYTPSISPIGSQKLKNEIINCDMSFNKIGLLRLMAEDGFGEFNWTDLMRHFRKMALDS